MGARSASKLLEQPFSEEMNKAFALGAFTASEENIFPSFQCLWFSSVNDLLIRSKKLIIGGKKMDIIFFTHLVKRLFLEWQFSLFNNSADFKYRMCFDTFFFYKQSI